MVLGVIGNGDGGLLIGLSFQNLKLLGMGQPIVKDVDQLGIKGKLIIFAGETEAEMVRYLREKGVLMPDAPVSL